MVSDKDIAHIKQWMTLANEFLEGLAKDGRTLHLPSDTQRKLRLMHSLVETMETPAASLEVPFLYVCLSCGKGFEHPVEELENYHKVEYSKHCPHCNSVQFKKNA